MQVTINATEFAKEFHYFLTCQLDGESEKRRTDVSACVTNPVFSANQFYLPISTEQILGNPRLHFAAFIVTDRRENAADYENKGKANLLGDCTLEIGPILPQLTDVHGLGIRKLLAFGRKKDGVEQTVGRFSITLKIVGDYMSKYESLDGQKLTGPKKATS